MENIEQVLQGPLHEAAAASNFVRTKPIIITIRGGLAYLCDDTNPQGIPISIRDYDITDYITDEERAQLPVDAKGNPYEERGNV
jgi:hypothetical protein